MKTGRASSFPFAQAERKGGQHLAAGQHGFTLVEVLVALLVFGILAAAGVALLSFSVRAQAASAAKLDDLSAIERTFAILSADAAQADARPVRDGTGATLPAFAGAAAGDVQPFLRLARGGWTNLDAEARAGVQRVDYRLAGGTLERLAYPRLDGAQPLPPQPLLAHVRAVRLRYRYHGAWSARWDGAGAAPLPQALEIGLTRDDGTDYHQILLVGTGWTPPPPAPPHA